MILLSVVDGYEHFRETCALYVQGRCRQPVPLKCWSLSTELHSTTTQKTVILKPKYPIVTNFCDCYYFFKCVINTMYI